VVSNDMKTHTKMLLFTGVTLNWTYLPMAKLRLKAGTSLERDMAGISNFHRAPSYISLGSEVNNGKMPLF